MPTILHFPVSRVSLESNWLAGSAQNVASQIGQDGILNKIFSIIGTTNAFCIEFGAWDGKLYSNTWHLIENCGWRGVLIEANPDKFADIAKNHMSDRVIALNQFVEMTGNDTLDNIMVRVGQTEPDLLSLDIDGNEWHIWNSMHVVRPRVILVEFNPTVPNDVFFVQDRSPSINQGASLLAMIELAKHKGYSLACAHHWDAFFVRDDLYAMLGIKDNSIDLMYTPEWETKIFQCFDGKLFTAGVKKLLWSGVDFSEEQLQILPPAAQRYADAPR